MFCAHTNESDVIEILAQVEEYLAGFTGTKETALFLSKSQYGIDTDKKEAKGEKVKLSKAVVCVSSRLTIFQKGSIFTRSLSVRCISSHFIEADIN